MYFQVEKQEVHGNPSSVQKEFTVLTNVLPSRKKSSLFLLMYFQVEKQEVHGHPSSVQKEFTVLTNVLPSRKIQKAAALKNTVIINCIYIRITVLKKHCNSARVICSTKLYRKYKKHKSHLLNKTLLITNWYQSTQNCKIIEPLAHHLFQTNIKNYRATCSTKNDPQIGTKVPKHFSSVTKSFGD